MELELNKELNLFYDEDELANANALFIGEESINYQLNDRDIDIFDGIDIYTYNRVIWYPSKTEEWNVGINPIFYYANGEKYFIEEYEYGGEERWKEIADKNEILDNLPLDEEAGLIIKDIYYNYNSTIRLYKETLFYKLTELASS